MRDTLLAASLLAASAFADDAPTPTSTGLSGAQSSAVFAAWYLYAMTAPADPAVRSLVQYVATAVPTTDYTFTSSALPTSFDLEGYLNSPPAPTFPAWVADIPDDASRSAYSSLIVSLEEASISLGKLATAGTINGTLFPGIVPATATAWGTPVETTVTMTKGGSTITKVYTTAPVETTAEAVTMAASVVSQITDGQIQAPTAPAAPAASSSMMPVAMSSSVAPAPAPASSSPAVVSQITDGQIQAPTAPAAPASSGPATSVLTATATVFTTLKSTSATTVAPSTASAASATATVAPYKGAAGKAGVSVLGAIVAGVVGAAALL